MIINDINEINKLLDGKVFDRVIQNVDGITILFLDGTKFKIKTYQYQIDIQ